MQLLMAFYRFALFLYQNITLLYYAVKYKVPCVMLSTGSPSSGLKLKIVWWRHKNEISEIMGFVRIFWKNNVQEAYLPKMSISGQIVSEIVAQLCLENSIQTLLNFFGVDPDIFVRYFDILGLSICA